MGVRDEVSAKLSTFVSKRVAVLTGTSFFGDDIIGKIVGLGVNPNSAFWGVVGLAALFMALDTYQNIKTNGIAGVVKRIADSNAAVSTSK